MIKQNDYSDEILLKALSNIKPDDVVKYMKELINESSITSFFYGNLVQDNVPNVLLLNKYFFNHNVKIPELKTLKNINITHPNKNEKNNNVNFYFPIGKFNPLTWLNCFLIELILQPKFFQILRTHKQLGYLVNFNFTNISEEYFFIEKIQSNKTCSEVAKEMNIFNSTILDEIKKVNLEEIKTSAKNQLKENENTITEVYNRYLAEIISRKYLFNRKKIILDQMHNITLESLINFCKKYLINNPNKIEFYLNSN